MKKAVKIAITFAFLTLLLCTLLAIGVNAASPVISADSVTAKAGETADITLTLTDNPGLIVMRLGLGYNDEYFSVKSVADTEILKDNMHSTTVDKSPYILYWNNPLMRTNITESGKLCVVTFNVDANTPNGTYDITIEKKNSDILTTDLKKIGDSFETVVGKITVTGGKDPVVEDDDDYSGSSSLKDDTPALTVSSKKITAGEEFDVTVTMSNNPGIIALRAMLDYDDEYFTLKKVVDNDILGESITSDDLSSDPYILYWSNPLLTKNITKNGKLVTLTFQSKKNTPAGKYNFSLSCDKSDIIDTDLKLYGNEFDLVKGVITVVASGTSNNNTDDGSVVTGKGYTIAHKNERVTIALTPNAVSLGDGVLISLDIDTVKAALGEAVKKFYDMPIDIVVTYSGNADAIVNIPEGYAALISDVESFTIDTEMIDIVLDSKAVKEMEDVKKYVQFTIGVGEPDKAVKNALEGDYTYFDVSSTMKFEDAGVKVILAYPTTYLRSFNLYAVNDDELAEITDGVSAADNTLSFYVTELTPYVAVGETVKIKFTDIENHWARENIEFVVVRGIFNGKSEEIFDPDSVLSRGMLVTVLGRLENVDTSKYDCTFDDVGKDIYYAPYIEWARQNNIVGGVGDNKFEPERSVTRQEIAVIVARYLEYKGLELKLDAMGYTDEASIDTWAKDAVNKVGNAGIITGVGTEFQPKNDATRAQAATILNRIVDFLDK